LCSLQILDEKIGKLRKYKRNWTYYFSPLLICSESTFATLQGRVIRFIRQHKALSLVTSLSIIVLLGNLFLVPAQNPIIIVEKSQFPSQPACLSCSSSNGSDSSNSGDKFQEPFLYPPRLLLTRNTPATTVSPSSIPVSTPTTNTQTILPTQGSINLFPYGSCTWWANQRYFQLHGIFVPWQTQSNAWQWTARAYQFGWHVSSSPFVGAIIDLQPGVQGASWAGHVAVVERILSNGDVIASNMNWGAYPWQVTYVEFAPGPGVTFLYL
jgi:surface antigen